MKEYELTWRTIYYHDELDTDNSILHTEYVQEAKYRTGYLIKSAMITHFNRAEPAYAESIVFVPQ